MALEALCDDRQRPGDQCVEREHLPRAGTDRRPTAAPAAYTIEGSTDFRVLTTCSAFKIVEDARQKRFGACKTV